jgi:membrane protease YdiL (CAAX protease family)
MGIEERLGQVPGRRRLTRQLSFVLVLLGLRFLLGWLPFDSQVLEPFYQIPTFLLIALFIWLERDDLAAYHIDKLSIILLILFVPLSTLVLPVFIGNSSWPMAFPNLPALCLWWIAILFFFMMRGTLSAMPWPRAKGWSWVGMGAAGGLVLALVMVLVWLPIRPHSGDVPEFEPWMLWSFVYQVGYAGLMEEPVFRGMLWGTLRKLGWGELWIWLLQAVLFSAAHGAFWQDSNAILSGVSILVGGLFFGFLAWRARSIAPGALAHAFYNAGSMPITILISILSK